MKKYFLSVLLPLFLFPAFFINVNFSLAQQDVDDEDEFLQVYFAEDELVEVVARVPKPMARVAENVSVITAAEIARMNAHNVSEVLNRVPGVFMQFNGRGFNQNSTIFVQDSDYEHVLVLVDGIRWNDINAGMAELNGIPVEIIDRIEVIKGPASSSWGSSLGGVVNIITRSTGNNTRPSGTISASYGENNSQEYSASMAGKAGIAGYFLSAGSQSSDGFLHNRKYDRNNVYGKLSLTLPHSSRITLSSGYSEPEQRFFDWPEYNYGAQGIDRNFWSKLNFDSMITDNIGFNVNAFRYEQKYVRDYYLLPGKTSFYKAVNDNLNKGFGSQLSWRAGANLLVFGGEFERGSTDDESNTDYDESWALYLNDTITLGPVTLIPGIRYDHLSLTDNMVSPSLGLTWQTGEQTLLRFLVSRGFRKPYMTDVAISSANLDPETVTSYQAGLETTALDWCRLKVNLFEHRIKDEWTLSSLSSLYNGGKAKRYGYEMELNTIPWHSFSILSSFCYVYTDYYGDEENDDTYTGKITILYQNPQLFTAELFGRYMWWNEDRASADNPPAYGNMVWDLSLTRELRMSEQTSIDIFFAAHNLFDSRDYWIDLYDNAHRWVEAGLRFHF